MQTPLRRWGSIVSSKSDYLFNFAEVAVSKIYFIKKLNLLQRMDLNNAKRIAAYQAVDEWVTNRSNKIGIGSGSTIVFAVERLAERVKNEDMQVVCVPTSFQARQLILQHNLRLSNLDIHPNLDVVFDGADEVDKNLTLIKGGGGCLLQEKIVASCALSMVVVADYTKNSQKLGDNYKKGIPIEVIPAAYVPIQMRIQKQYGGIAQLRIGIAKAGPCVTDNGNFILDWQFPDKEAYDWAKLNTELIQIPGIVETGLFVNLATKVYFGMSNGEVRIQER